MVRISICVPTYNGSRVLAGLLDSIILQHPKNLEIVICDDGSKDDTFQIAESYAEKHEYIRVFRNEKNLGMDRNFTQTVRHATGEYIWFTGQDDIFEKGAIAKLDGILDGNPGVDFIYFNYRFKSGDLTREVEAPPLNLPHDYFFKNSDEYFRVVDHAPSFLAAVVMRRKFWQNPGIESFFGTHYVQVGVWLSNFLGRSSYVVADPSFITCRMPEDSWKYKGGQMIFEIFSGSLEVYHRVFHGPRNPIPRHIYQRQMSAFLRLFWRNMFVLQGMGFRMNQKLRERLKFLYADWPLLYWSYVVPFSYVPPSLARLVTSLYRFLQGGSARRR